MDKWEATVRTHLNASFTTCLLEVKKIVFRRLLINEIKSVLIVFTSVHPTTFCQICHACMNV